MYFVEAVGYLRQLGRKQRLLGGQHFQIGRAAMLHQQFRALHGALQRLDLLYPQIGLRAGRLTLRKGVVHLGAGVEQRLLERQLGLLLLCLGDLHAGAVGIGVEDRLQKRCRRRPKDLAGIFDPHAAVVGPSERAAQCDRGIKG